MFTKLIIAISCLGLVSFANGQNVLCVTCNSTVTPACSTNPTSLATALCTTSCYTKIDEGEITRGCTAALATGSVCNSAECYQCSTNGCNANQTICQTCTDCGGLSSTNTTLSAICQIAESECYVGMATTGTVDRRCAVTTDSCSGTNATCALCTGVNCNNYVYPPVKKNGANIDTITTSVLLVSVLLASLKLA